MKPLFKATEAARNFVKAKVDKEAANKEDYVNARLQVSLNTYNNFVNGDGVARIEFKKICSNSGLDFEESIERDHSTNPIQNFTHNGSANFVGREQELNEIQKAFQESTSIVAITAVAGMGGVGKTELAIQFAREHESDYPGGIFWLNASGSNLAANIIVAAKHLNVPKKDKRGKLMSDAEKVQWCWQNWHPPEGLVLIVLDDVTDLKAVVLFSPK